jgi:hypothetical protein
MAGDYEGSYKPGDIFVLGSNIPHVLKWDLMTSPILTDILKKSRELHPPNTNL